MGTEISGGKRNGLQSPRQLLHSLKQFIATGGEGRKHHPSGVLTGKAVSTSGLTPGCYSSTIPSHRPWHPASLTRKQETNPEDIQLRGDCLLPAKWKKLVKKSGDGRKRDTNPQHTCPAEGRSPS